MSAENIVGICVVGGLLTLLVLAMRAVGKDVEARLRQWRWHAICKCGWKKAVPGPDLFWAPSVCPRCGTISCGGLGWKVKIMRYHDGKWEEKINEDNTNENA